MTISEKVFFYMIFRLLSGIFLQALLNFFQVIEAEKRASSKICLAKGEKQKMKNLYSKRIELIILLY